jgi:Chromo (CHRromatin Organisation MOdifier) domain
MSAGLHTRHSTMPASHSLTVTQRDSDERRGRPARYLTNGHVLSTSSSISQRLSAMDSAIDCQRDSSVRGSLKCSELRASEAVQTAEARSNGRLTQDRDDGFPDRMSVFTLKSSQMGAPNIMPKGKHRIPNQQVPKALPLRGSAMELEAVREVRGGFAILESLEFLVKWKGHSNLHLADTWESWENVKTSSVLHAWMSCYQARHKCILHGKPAVNSDRS